MTWNQTCECAGTKIGQSLEPLEKLGEVTVEDLQSALEIAKTLAESEDSIVLYLVAIGAGEELAAFVAVVAAAAGELVIDLIVALIIAVTIAVIVTAITALIECAQNPSS